MSDKSSTEKQDLVPTEVFSCFKCGALLFRKDQLLQHTPGQQQLLFEKKKHDKHPAYVCMSYFLSSCPPWVKNKDLIECKIYCPKCSSRIGMLHWQGTQCSCGTWVNPGIQFPKAKVDLKTVLLPRRKRPEEEANKDQEAEAS